MGRRKGAGLDPEVGARIREIRQSKGLTLKHLAERAGFDQPNLSKLETGLIGFSAESIRRIARALDVPVADLFSPGTRGPAFWVPFRDDPSRPMLAIHRHISDEAFALEVSEDVLAPVIQRGDIVVCERALPASMGRIVVAQHGDNMIVRRVRRTRESVFSKKIIKDKNGPRFEKFKLEQEPIYELYVDNNLVPPIQAQRDTACFLLGPVVERITDMLAMPI